MQQYIQSARNNNNNSYSAKELTLAIYEIQH